MKKTIQILGPGCPKCQKLSEEAEKAAKELGLEYEIVKVKDLKEIMKYGVLTTPGLAVDGKVKAVGKVLDSKQIKEILGKDK
jgi:small redox-active disulfide protein 2